MPEADTAFVIGVIREKEKGLLEEDEYTRVIQAPDAGEARNALLDTPYGIHLASTVSAPAAIIAHSAEVLAWLRDVVADKRILEFISARFDALHIANGIMEFRDGKKTMCEQIELGHIPCSVLYNGIWHGTDLDIIPSSWRSFIESEVALSKEDNWEKSALLARTKDQLVSVMKELSFTDLMYEISALTEKHFALDSSIRSGLVDSTPDVEKISSVPCVATASAQDITDAQSAVAYEKCWDEEMLRLIRQHKHSPTGYDTVLAFWYAKELEAKTLRLLMAAKLGGLGANIISSFKRSLYRSL